MREDVVDQREAAGDQVVERQDRVRGVAREHRRRELTLEPLHEVCRGGKAVQPEPRAACARARPVPLRPTGDFLKRF